MNEKRKNKIDTLLANCNYSVDDDYVPSKFAYLMINFIMAVQGDKGGETNASPVAHYKMLDSYDDNEKDRVVNLCHRGYGKMEPGSNILPTPHGYRTMKELQVGDKVFDRYGSATTITHKTEPIRQQCYKVKFGNGTEIIFGKNHNVLIVTSINATQDREYTKVVTVEEIFNSIISTPVNRKTTKSPKNTYKFRVPIASPAKYPSKPVSHDPYLVGIYFALGSKLANQIVQVDAHFNKVVPLLKKAGISFNMPAINRITLEEGLMELRNTTDGSLPEEYLLNTINVRMEMLRGLLDSHSIYARSKSINFIHHNKNLVYSVRELVLSLGGLAVITKTNNVYRLRIRIRIGNPFKFHIGSNKWKPGNYQTLPIVSVEKVDVDEDCYCIQVAADNHCYLTKDYTVTHNTTLNEYVILLTAAMGGFPNFGKFKYGIYVSDTIGNGVKRMRNRLDVQLANSEFLKEIFAETRITDERWYFRTHSGTEMVWTGHGVEKPPRGSVELRERFSVALLDDLFSDKNARSARILQNIRNTIYSAIVFGLNPNKQKIIWSGTPFNASDPLYQAVNSSSWFANVFPVCEKFPVPKEEFRGSWEDRFDYDYVKKMYDKAVEDKSLSSFFKELMLTIAHNEFKMVVPGMIGSASRNLIRKYKDNFNFYITTDFATKEDDANDYSVALVIAINSIGNMYIVDGFCEKQTMLTNINELIRLAQKWNPITVGFEVSGQQGGFLSLIDEKMIATNVYFSIAREKSLSSERYGKRGFHPTTNKLDRFLAFYPIIEAGKLFMVEELNNSNLAIEMEEELELVTREEIKSLHDDVIDALSMIPLMHMQLPSGEATFVELERDTPRHSPKTAAERAIDEWARKGERDSAFRDDISLDDTLFYTEDHQNPYDDISSYYGED